MCKRTTASFCKAASNIPVVYFENATKKSILVALSQVLFILRVFLSNRSNCAQFFCVVELYDGFSLNCSFRARYRHFYVFLTCLRITGRKFRLIIN